MKSWKEGQDIAWYATGHAGRAGCCEALEAKCNIEASPNEPCVLVCKRCI